MKVTGIIAEYNPFHRGHKYQIDYCKKELHSDYVVVAMSGDYVQRGTPALLPKHSRAEMALRCGADLVLELPVSVSTASAEASSGTCAEICAIVSCVRVEVKSSRIAEAEAKGGFLPEMSADTA